MKKSFSILICLVLIVSMLLVGCGKSSAPDSTSVSKPIELNLNSSNPSTHKNYINGMGPWAKLVEEKTNGRVKINVHHALALGPINAVWKDLNGGIYDIGFANMPYFFDSELYPFTIGLLPFAFPDSLIAAKVLNKFAEKYSGDIFKNTVLLGIGSTDPYSIFSKKPINSVADLKGKKIRVPGRSEGAIIENAGGTPVSIALSEIYESISKNIADAAVYTPVGALAVKLHEVAPYFTKVNLSVVPYLIIMNKTAFESMPADVQKLFKEELGRKLSDLMSESYFNESGAAITYMMKEAGSKGGEIKLSEGDQNKLFELAKPLWDGWVAEATKKGYPGQEMMDYFKQLLKDEGVNVPF